VADNLPARYRQAQVTGRVEKNASVAAARVSAVTHVSHAAMLGTLSVGMSKREAALLLPEDAAKFDLIATQAAIGMAMQINWVSAQW
jgi:hypothetical protein